MQELIQDIKESLEYFVDEASLNYAIKRYPTKLELLRVATANLKTVFREIKVFTKNYHPSQKLELVKAFVDENVFELQQLAFAYLATDKRLRDSLTLEDIDELSQNLDNWLAVDYYAINVVGIAWREQKLSTEKIKDYLNSGDVWLRRLAISATIALNKKTKGGTGSASRTLEICSAVVEDHREEISKALTNALYELAKADKIAVVEFFEKNRGRLSHLTVKELQKKLNLA